MGHSKKVATAQYIPPSCGLAAGHLTRVFFPECWQREFAARKAEGPPVWRAFPSYRCARCATRQPIYSEGPTGNVRMPP